MSNKKSQEWYSTNILTIYLRKGLITISHLFYSYEVLLQYITIVKVHGVFPSSRKYSASSQRFQFHWGYVGDSRTVITPFMRDTN